MKNPQELTWTMKIVYAKMVISGTKMTQLVRIANWLADLEKENYQLSILQQASVTAEKKPIISLFRFYSVNWTVRILNTQDKRTILS